MERWTSTWSPGASSSPSASGREHPTVAVVEAPEVLPGHAEEIAARLLGELLGGEVPGRRGKGEALGLLLDDDGGHGLGIDLGAGDDDPVAPAGVLVGFEDHLGSPRTDDHGGVLADAEAILLLEIVDQGGDHLGGGAGRFPVVELLVEQQPLDHPVPAVVGGIEFREHPQRKRVGLDGVVVPEPGAVLGRPVGAEITIGLGRVHDRVEDQHRIVVAAGPL